MHTRRCSECAQRVALISVIEDQNPLVCGLGNERTRGRVTDARLDSIWAQIRACEEREMARWEEEADERARELEAQGYVKTWDFEEREYVWIAPR